MAGKVISKERLDYTVDLLVAMAVEEIAEETGREAKFVLADFVQSKTGKSLYDTDTKIWCNGPTYIADMYMQERKNNQCSRDV